MHFFKLSILAFIVFVVVLFSSSVFASEDPSLEAIDILDYSMPNDGNITQVSTSNGQVIRFNVPFAYATYFWDLIIVCPVSISSCEIVGNTSSVSLTVSHIEGKTYRCYGRSSTAYSPSNIGVRFVTSSSGNYAINFLKFDAYTVVNTGVGDLGELNVTPNADTSVSTNYWYRQSSPGVTIVQDFYYFSSSNQFTDFDALFSSVNWRQYDYLDFSFRICASSISSISCYIAVSNGVYRYLPFEISYLNGDIIDKNEYIGSGSTTVIPGSGQWDIILRVFIPASYRLSGSLYIDVSGQYHNQASRAYLFSVNGYYNTSFPDPYMVKLDSIEAAIKESLSSSSDDNAAAEQFSDSMTSQKEQMSANQNIVNSVDRPSSDSLGEMVSPSAVLDSSGMGYLTAIITPLSTSRIVLAILTLAGSLALVSYVFFGKKR